MSDSTDESEDPEREAAWIAEQRECVLRYLAGQHVQHTGVAESPAWFVAPYVAIWSVGSKTRPGAVGWWAISGDVPTDYASSSEIRDARMAVRVFSRRWKRASKQLADGKKPDGFTMGPPDMGPELAPLLASRAKLLGEWADSDELWS